MNFSINSRGTTIIKIKWRQLKSYFVVFKTWLCYHSWKKQLHLIESGAIMHFLYYKKNYTINKLSWFCLWLQYKDGHKTFLQDDLVPIFILRYITRRTTNLQNNTIKFWCFSYQKSTLDSGHLKICFVSTTLVKWAV